MKGHLQDNFEKARWGLLLLFAFGYSITYARFSYNAGDYLVYSLLAASSCALLLSQIKSYEKKYSAIWLGLGIFVIVYFVRFYWIAIDPLPVKVMLHTPVYHKMIQDHALFEGFRISAIAFAAFCISASLLLFIYNRDNDLTSRTTSVSAESSWGIAKVLLLVLPIIMLVLALLAHKYHIGEMGAASGEPLPFRLKGIIFYARFVMIPLLIILLIYLSARSGHIIISRLAIILLLAHGTIDMLLRGSRSSLLLCILLIVFLVMSGGLKLYRNEKILALFALSIGLFMVPIMTEYRMHRVVDNLPVIDAISTSLSAIGSEGWSTLLGGVEFAFFRMPGIEALSAIIGMDTEPLGMRAIEVIQAKQGIAGYLTHDVYLITKEANTLGAPGFIGWFYLVGGLAAVIVGSILLSVIIVVIWKMTDSRYFVCPPVVRTFFLWMLFHGLTEGTLDSMLFMLAVGVLTIFAIELMMRSSEGLTSLRLMRSAR